MPVYKLAEEMPYEELLGWMDYFDRRPIGWREDDRAFKLMQAQGVKAKAQEVFPGLKALYERKPKKDIPEGGVDIESIKSSPFFLKMMTAVGGDQLKL